MLPHGLTGDHLVGVIIAKGEGILGLGTLIGKFWDVGETFFHDGYLTFLW
jgi:hypothetical protein